MLKHIQEKFKAAIFDGKDEIFIAEIEGGGKISPKQRLFIYSHAYKSRLVETLSEDFPVLHSLVGDDMFEEICLGYIDQYPSTNPSLRYFGEHMTKYLQSTKPYSDIVPAIEMARFEWTFNDVFDAADKDAVSADDVGAVPPQAWTTLRIHLQPSFFINEYKWNTPAVWLTVSDELDNKPMMPQEYPVASHCIQWKTNLKCYFRTVTDDEAAVLKIAAQSKTFPEICEMLIDEYEGQATMRAAELFKGWVTEGLVARLEYLKF